MAGFEVVVRPAVFPDIRPAPAQSQAPASDPTKDIAVIHGSSGQHIDLPFSWTVTTSSSRSLESKRRFDLVRVYQKGGGGGAATKTLTALSSDTTVNKDNFVDIEVVNKIWMNDGGMQSRYSYARVQEDDNIEILERDKTRRINS